MSWQLEDFCGGRILDGIGRGVGRKRRVSFACPIASRFFFRSTTFPAVLPVVLQVLLYCKLKKNLTCGIVGGYDTIF